MNRAVIGIDTSNYRTSAAAVTMTGQMIYNGRLLLPVATGERGLRQSDAVFAHLKQLPEVTAGLRECLKDCKIIAVTASTRPRGRNDSYMPVFQVGERFGMSLADLLDVPFLETDHQSGHIAAAAYGTSLSEEQNYLAVHLSGGTTDLLHVSGGKITEIGGSLDLHAGQLVDRVGVALGMKFPAGPELEELALKGRSQARLGTSMEQTDLFCHFSGAETQAIRWIRDCSVPKEDIAAEVYDLLARTTVRMIAAGVRETGCRKVLAAGGVSASALFRSMLLSRIQKTTRNVTTVFGQENLSGDNAVGVALIGMRILRGAEDQNGCTDS